jgi:hypothetical protein
MDERRRQDLIDQISAYLDDELDEDERRAVEALLAEDEAARAQLDALRRTIASVRELPRAKADDTIIEGVRARMERRALLDEDAADTTAGSEPLRSGRWMAAAAICMMTLGAGYLVWDLTGPEERPARNVAPLARMEPEEQVGEDGGERLSELDAASDEALPRDERSRRQPVLKETRESTSGMELAIRGAEPLNVPDAIDTDRSSSASDVQTGPDSPADLAFQSGTYFKQGKYIYQPGGKPAGAVSTHINKAPPPLRTNRVEVGLIYQDQASQLLAAEILRNQYPLTEHDLDPEKDRIEVDLVLADRDEFRRLMDKLPKPLWRRVVKTHRTAAYDKPDQAGVSDRSDMPQTRPLPLDGGESLPESFEMYLQKAAALQSTNQAAGAETPGNQQSADSARSANLTTNPLATTQPTANRPTQLARIERFRDRPTTQPVSPSVEGAALQASDEETAYPLQLNITFTLPVALELP